jgi:hypothetical protein
MGNTYRNRPKYQVADIIEEYYYNYEKSEGYIDTFMIMAIEYKRRKYISYIRPGTVNRENNPYKYKVKYTWYYTMRDMLTGGVEITSCRSMDKGAITKKVG